MKSSRISLCLCLWVLTVMISACQDQSKDDMEVSENRIRELTFKLEVEERKRAEVFDLLEKRLVAMEVAQRTIDVDGMRKEIQKLKDFADVLGSPELFVKQWKAQEPLSETVALLSGRVKEMGIAVTGVEKGLDTVEGLVNRLGPDTLLTHIEKIRVDQDRLKEELTGNLAHAKENEKRIDDTVKMLELFLKKDVSELRTEGNANSDKLTQLNEQVGQIQKIVSETSLIDLPQRIKKLTEFTAGFGNAESFIRRVEEQSRLAKDLESVSKKSKDVEASVQSIQKQLAPDGIVRKLDSLQVDQERLAKDLSKSNESVSETIKKVDESLNVLKGSVEKQVSDLRLQLQTQESSTSEKIDAITESVSKAKDDKSDIELPDTLKGLLKDFGVWDVF